MTATKLQVLVAHFGCTEMSMTPRNAKWIDVASLEEASTVATKYIYDNDLGSRDWFGGIVRDDKKNPVAVIQFNGRIETDLSGEAGFLSNAKKLIAKK